MQDNTAIKGLIDYFARNPVAANLLMVFLIISGLIAATQLTVQQFPALDLRTITVTIASPGSTAEEVEQDINRRVEESIVGLIGVDRVKSFANESYGKIVIELESFADAESVLIDVENSIDRIPNFPPARADQPKLEINKVTPEVLTLAVSSETASENDLRQAAENIRSELLEAPFISHVTLHGVRDREITIELDQEQLRRYNLSFAEIARNINRESTNRSHGLLNTDSGSIILHTISKRTKGEEFADIPLISSLDGSIITVGDVAEITDGFADYEVHSELNGVPTVFVRVDADENQSISQIADTVYSWLSNKSFPEHIEVRIWNDRSKQAIDRIFDLISSGLIGLVLVFICLVLVFDLRVATWVTVGIPLSFIGSFLLFGVTGLTLNIGTIFAFFLLIGIVVDDAVVVGESIAAERQRGLNALDAAISGARKVVGPITIGVITTAIAFTPLLFITEERYQVFNVIPLVAIFVLFVSLVEVFCILPAHLSHERPWSLSPLREIQNHISSRLETLRDQLIVPVVSWSIRHVVKTPVIAVVVVVVAIFLLYSGAVKIILVDHHRNVSNNIKAELFFPVGTPFDLTKIAAERVAQAAWQTADQLEGESIKSVSVIVGAPALALYAHETIDKSNYSHIAWVNVHFNERPPRTVSIPEFEQAWRPKIDQTAAFQRVVIQSSRFETEPNIAYSLRHHDRQVLKAAAGDLRRAFESEPGIYNVNDNASLGKRQFEVAITPEGRLAGLDPANLGSQLRSGFQGLDVQHIQRGHEEIKVVTRYPREQRTNLDKLWSERVHQSGGGEIPLSLVAEISESNELASLFRINGEKAISVSGFADTAITTPIEMRRKISESYIPEILDKYPGLKIEIDGGARNEYSVLKLLAILVPLVFLAMYVVVAAFLRSYWKPVIVIFGVPIAFAGAVFAHWTLGWDFTIASTFGVIGVVGVIVNDSLVLLHRYNVMRTEQSELPAIAAASGAMRQRFRAVFLTSLTTIVGLSPLLYERNEELLVLVPFVVSMLGGLIFASLFTLFILPTLVMLIDGRRS